MPVPAARYPQGWAVVISLQEVVVVEPCPSPSIHSAAGCQRLQARTSLEGGGEFWLSSPFLACLLWHGLPQPFWEGVGKPDVSPGVLAHILGAAASSSWVDPVEQPVPLSSVPPPALAPGPPPFLAPSVLISCLALPGAVALHPQREAVAILGRLISPERKEGGRGKSIGAKCGGHEPCRGCGMGCLERSAAF